MKRKDAIRRLDDISKELDRVKATCVFRGKKINTDQVTIGLMTGLLFAKGLLENEADLNTTPKEDSLFLLGSTVEFCINEGIL